MLNIKNAIKSLNLFTNLNEEEIEFISSISHTSKYEANSVLMYESESTDKLLFLIEGLIKVYKIDKYDNEIFLYYIYSNSMISELSNLNENKINCFSNTEFLRESIILSIEPLANSTIIN